MTAIGALLKMQEFSRQEWQRMDAFTHEELIAAIEKHGMSAAHETVSWAIATVMEVEKFKTKPRGMTPAFYQMVRGIAMGEVIPEVMSMFGHREPVFKRVANMPVDIQATLVKELELPLLPLPQAADEEIIPIPIVLAEATADELEVLIEYEPPKTSRIRDIKEHGAVQRRQWRERRLERDNRIGPKFKKERGYFQHRATGVKITFEDVRYMWDQMNG